MKISRISMPALSAVAVLCTFAVLPAAPRSSSRTRPLAMERAFDFDGSDGENSLSGLIADNGGNLYGVTAAGGQYGEGTVFELVRSGRHVTENVLYNFTGGVDGAGPEGSLVF